MKTYKLFIAQKQHRFELVALGSVQAKSKKEAIKTANEKGFFGKLTAEQS